MNEEAGLNNPTGSLRGNSHCQESRTPPRPCDREDEDGGEPGSIEQPVPQDNPDRAPIGPDEIPAGGSRPWR